MMINNMCQKHFVHSSSFFTFSLLMLLSFTTTNATTKEVANVKCIDNERDALLHFKSCIHRDPEGLLSTWTRKEEKEEEEATDDCCKWSGVACNDHTGHVTSLDLSVGRLEGEISHSLFNLTYLQRLAFPYNSFYGAIPMSIGFMTQLMYLDMCYNAFNGTIPVFIGSMTQLGFLYLGGNDFTGNIPSELGNLTNLQHLSLEHLTSCTFENIDWLSHLSQLVNLHMSGTSLAKADRLVNVILNLQTLSLLSLNDCDLSQIINPYDLYPRVNSSVSSSLDTLDLGNNNLNSYMYHWLFPLTSNMLEFLDLSSNKIDNAPRYLGNLCGLRSLDVHNNSMASEFSIFVSNLSGCTSVALQRLYASSNQFLGSVSDDIQNFSSLEYLDLFHNQLNGTLSEKVWELPNLLIIDVSSNSLKGVISENIGKSSKIMTTSFSNDSLVVVPIKVNISNISISSKLMTIDLSKNKFYGGINFLCEIKIRSLQFLDLSHNSFTGQIPDCWKHSKLLRVLNLGHNNFSKTLPGSMKDLINLEALYLNNNRFLGEFPLFLKNCRELTFLDLGLNNFSGYVPFWISENLPSLYVLRLTSNNFFGTIPVQLCHLVNLTILDLSINNLYGTIPSCLNNLTSMVAVKGRLPPRKLPGLFISNSYVDHAMIKWQGTAREFSNTIRLVKSIDLSRNNLTGVIPYELGDLSDLITLDLSMNSLHGEIPSKIGLMKNLLHLDVSRNNLSGPIPTSMSLMTSLDYLDLSHNNLSGRIPSSTQLQSFEPSKYTENQGLCGPPLSKYCPGDKQLEETPFIGQSDDKDELESWFYIGCATGFAIGFWIACGALLANCGGVHCKMEKNCKCKI